ncbi:MAG: RsmE family RNA methyltransferase [Bdellovibrionota bacterium]
MNLLLLYPEELDQGNALLKGKRAKELIDRHGLKSGDSLKVGIRNQGIGSGLVTIQGEELIIDFTLEREPPARRPIFLICGISRPQTVKKVIQSAVLFGIKELHFVRASQAEKSYLDSQIFSEEVLERHLALGLEQAIDTISPTIEIHRQFKPFIEDYLSKLNSQNLKILADISGEREFPKSIKQESQSIVLSVGPEAGWSDFEIECFTQSGFMPYSFGERVLRVETAVNALLGLSAEVKTL